MAGLGTAGQTGGRRARGRILVARPSTVRADGILARDVIVEDLSRDGFSFTSALPFAADTVLSVGLAGAGQAEARVVRCDDIRYGCVFEPPLTPAQLDAAFSHPTTAAIARPVVGTAPRGWSPAGRLALMLGIGLGGWGGFALTAHFL